MEYQKYGPEVHKRPLKGVDMHALTFKGLSKASTNKLLTCSISTCIICKNLLQYPERF